MDEKTNNERKAIIHCANCKVNYDMLKLILGEENYKWYIDKFQIKESDKH